MGFLRAKNENVDRLTGLCLGIITGEAGKDEILKQKHNLDTVTPFEVISVVETVIEKSEGVQNAKKNLSKILNVLYTGLRNYKWEPSAGNHFMAAMMAENNSLRVRLEDLKKKMAAISRSGGFASLSSTELDDFLTGLAVLENIESHYLKMENIFFPYLEKAVGDLKCFQIMWSIHDDVRADLKKIKNLDVQERNNTGLINNLIGDLYFSIYAIIFREELILFPASSQVIEDNIWDKMHEESFGIGFSFIDEPDFKMSGKPAGRILNSGMVDTGTGMLSPEIFRLILNSLPLDITFVDENDRVAYFSQPAERIFPRSRGVIGRKVQNCHPPESLDRVNAVMDAFKNGSSSRESFRIYLRDRYILIEYFAVRDQQDVYRGTLEVTSDITEVNLLDGEKRL